MQRISGLKKGTDHLPKKYSQDTYDQMFNLHRDRKNKNKIKIDSINFKATDLTTVLSVGGEAQGYILAQAGKCKEPPSFIYLLY